jgi:hypothetical protein
MRPKNFMRLAGVLEMALGAAVLKGPTRIGAYAASAWLAAITANLISSGKHFDVAARDANLAVAAFVLARFVREGRTTARAGTVGGSRVITRSM